MEPDDDDIFLDAGRDYVAKKEDQPKKTSYDVPMPEAMLGPQMPGPMQGPAMPASYNDGWASVFMIMHQQCSYRCTTSR